MAPMRDGMAQIQWAAYQHVCQRGPGAWSALTDAGSVGELIEWDGRWSFTLDERADVEHWL